MVRPATPLAFLLFVAFVLLLLSVISTPIVTGIPLATFAGVDYGVFGFCQGKACSGIKIGYGAVAGNSFYTDASFTIGASTRHSLATLLIVHPVAAFLTLVCLILAGTAHLHAPSHSPRYLLALIILLLPTLLVTLLAFLIDVLLFVPHLAWGGWIVLAATILLVAGGVLTCGMRRTLVSRKARKKRIAENSEMNGENLYNRQSGPRAESPPPLSQQPTAPMMFGAPGANKLPEFATFDGAKNRWPDDDSTPLNSRAPTVPSIASGMRSTASDESQDRYGQGRGGPPSMRGGRGGRYNGPRDEFGNPLPPGPGYGPGRSNSRDPTGRNQYPDDGMVPPGFRGRGRGGFMPRGRGGPYGGRGGPGMGGNGRGGPGMIGNGRGGPGMMGNGRGGPGMGEGIPLGAMAAGAGAGVMAGEMARGARGPPPGYARGGGPGQFGRNESAMPYGGADPYGTRQPPGPPSAPGYGPGPAYGRDPSPGPPSNPGYGNSQPYGRDPSPGPPSNPGYGNSQPYGQPGAPGYGFAGRRPSAGSQNGQPFARSSPPPDLPLDQPNAGHQIGQAVEMDESTGSPAHTPGFGPGYAFRDSDTDVAGLVNLQQNRADPSYGSQPAGAYASVRPEWGSGPGRNGSPPIKNPLLPPLSVVQQSPVELATHITPQTAAHTPQRARVHSGDNYYEDVDPRFSNPEPAGVAALPALLVAGSQQPQQPPPNQYATQQQQQYAPNERQLLEQSTSYDSIREGPSSDNSNFTSVSQRGVNPEWRPDGYGPGGIPNRRPVGQQR